MSFIFKCAAAIELVSALRADDQKSYMNEQLDKKIADGSVSKEQADFLQSPAVQDMLQKLGPNPSQEDIVKNLQAISQANPDKTDSSVSSGDQDSGMMEQMQKMLANMSPDDMKKIKDGKMTEEDLNKKMDAAASQEGSSDAFGGMENPFAAGPPEPPPPPKNEEYEGGPNNSMQYEFKSISEFMQKNFNKVHVMVPDRERMSRGVTTGLGKWKPIASWSELEDIIDEFYDWNPVIHCKKLHGMKRGKAANNTFLAAVVPFRKPQECYYFLHINHDDPKDFFKWFEEKKAEAS